MSRKAGTRLVLVALALCLTSSGAWYAFRPLPGPVPNGPEARAAGDGVRVADARPASPADPLERRFSTEVRPFLERYCFSCHGPKKQKGSLDLSRDSTVA